MPRSRRTKRLAVLLSGRCSPSGRRPPAETELSRWRSTADDIARPSQVASSRTAIRRYQRRPRGGLTRRGLAVCDLMATDRSGEGFVVEARPAAVTRPDEIDGRIIAVRVSQRCAAVTRAGSLGVVLRRSCCVVRPSAWCRVQHREGLATCRTRILTRTSSRVPPSGTGSSARTHAARRRASGCVRDPAVGARPVRTSSATCRRSSSSRCGSTAAASSGPVAARVAADPIGPGHRDDLQRARGLERLPAAVLTQSPTIRTLPLALLTFQRPAQRQRAGRPRVRRPRHAADPHPPRRRSAPAAERCHRRLRACGGRGRSALVVGGRWWATSASRRRTGSSRTRTRSRQARSSGPRAMTSGDAAAARSWKTSRSRG